MRTINTSAVFAAARHLRLAALLSLVALTLPTQFAEAVTFANYPFDGSSFSSTDAGTQWTTSSLSTIPQSGDTGLPLTTNAGGTSAGTFGNPLPAAEIQYGDLQSIPSDEVTLAKSLALDNYYSFTVTPNPSATLDFADLAFEIARTGGIAATAHVFSSVDGFNISDEIGSFTSPNVGSLDPGAIDVSSLTGVTSPVEFRIYLTRGAASNIDNTIVLDNIVLTGSFEVAPIPEPSSMMLLGLGALGLMRYSRRRVRRA